MRIFQLVSLFEENIGSDRLSDMISTIIYPFLLFFEEWALEKKDVTKAWDNKGDIIIRNDVWIVMKLLF